MQAPPHKRKEKRNEEGESGANQYVIAFEVECKNPVKIPVDTDYLRFCALCFTLIAELNLIKFKFISIHRTVSRRHIH